MRYIGSKRALLDNVNNLLNKHIDGTEQNFLDLFAGTNVVGSYFKDRYAIISNDLLYFSYVNAKATIENNEKVTFSGLKKINISDPFEYFNDDRNIKPINHYYENAYTPTGDTMYLTIENGRRIDFIRDSIDEWKDRGLLTDVEYYYLISVLIQAIPFVSNITGTYGAYLKKWDKRSLKKLKIKPLPVINNSRHNKSFNEDANDLIKRVKADITYVDTPYNNRQYASNYHLLENVARNNKPKLKGKTSIFDWKSLRSDYSMKKNALSAMEDLIKNLNSKHIILSYSNEGIIPEQELVDIINKYSTVPAEVEHIDYRKYKSKVKSKADGLNEILIYFSKSEWMGDEQHLSSKPRVETWSPRLKSSYIKSPLNYIGGKYKLLAQILPLFPDEINTFVDLFSGGANVGINVKANNYYFNDMNYRINEMFKYFSCFTSDELVHMIKSKIHEYGLNKTNKEAYLKLRLDYNKNPNPLDLYVLVSYGYNYQFRFNNSMEFNNPFGKNRSSFSENMEEHLRQFVDKLHTINAEFTNEMFEDFDISHLTSNDFVYMDPPYLITTGSYNDGNRGFVNWDEKQEKLMYDLMDRLTSRHIKYALSNVLEHKGQTNNLLKDYISKRDEIYVAHFNYTYRNSSYNTKNKSSDEVLITNYNPSDYQVDTLF